MKKGIFLAIAFWGINAGLFAQTPLQLGNPGQGFLSGYDGKNPLEAAAHSTLAKPSMPLIRPAFVQENPRGYSYLCRLELEIEEKLPVGIWIEAGDAQQSNVGIKSNAHLRLKLLHF